MVRFFTIFGMCLLGIPLGAAIGAGIGAIVVTVFDVTCFEGYCGYVVFLEFMPLGAFLGLIGAIVLGIYVTRPRSTDAA
jgi:hypothetical protein